MSSLNLVRFSTHVDGDSVWVNPQHVIKADATAFIAGKRITSLTLTGGQRIDVQASLSDTVRALVNNA